MTDVFLVQDDGYPLDQMTYGIAASVDASARLVRDFYPDDYNITWDEPVEVGGGNYEMMGHFGGKPGFCAPGDRKFLFTRYELAI